MSSKITMSGLVGLALSGLTANACLLQVRVACPNDTTASGIEVCVDGVGCGVTDNLGLVEFDTGGFGTFTVCVSADTLPAGATLNQTCQKIKVISDAPPLMEFVLGGSFCETPPPPGPCWLTGGGTIDKAKGTPTYTFGGVTYPGCSEKATDGGNWNVVNHLNGLHFQARTGIVDECRDLPTRSPRVTVRTILFHGEGRLTEDGSDGSHWSPCLYEARATDNKESGGGSDLFYLKVWTDAGTVLQIGTSDAPAVISTGNLQIHQSSCSK